MPDIVQPATEISHQHTRKVIRINTLITFLAFMDTPLLLPVMALYAADLGAGAGIAGLIIGLYSITSTPANILFGRLIDRVGHKAPLIAGLFGNALSMVLYILCRIPVQLALLRAFHGLTGSLISPATMSVMANYSTPGKKGRAMAFYGIALASAMLVGFGLSGAMSSSLSYTAIFLFGAGLQVVAAVLGFLMPASHKADRKAVSAISGFNRVKGFIRRKSLLTAYSAIFAQYFAFGGIVTLLPFYVKGLGMGSFEVGMLLAIFAIVFIGLQMPSGRLSDRIGRIYPTIAGLSLGIISLVSLPSATSFPLLAVAMAFFGVGYGLFFPSISALVADNAGAEERGMATGLFHACLTAGAAIGAPVIGWAGENLGTETGIRLSAIFMVIALMLAATIKVKNKIQR